MLRFDTIKYKNLLSTGNLFTEVSLDRSKTTLIIGHNGAGKSTLLEALCFVLYGRPFRDINKPQLINTITNRHLVVELTFKADGKPFRVLRGMKPNRFEIYRDETLVNQDDKNVDYQKWLETDILRMNYKSFKQIVVLGSAGYTPFMELKADARRIICEDILDIHVFSSMFSLLKKQIEETNEQLHDIMQTISKSKVQLDIHQQHVVAKQEDYDSVVQHLTSDINQYVEQITQLETDIEHAQEQQQLLSIEISDQNKVSATLEQVRGIERSIEDRLMRYRQEMKFYTDNHTCPTCSQDIDEDFKEQTVCKHNEQIVTLEKGIDEVEAKRLDLTERFEQIQQTINEIAQIGGIVRDKNVEIQLITKHIGQLNAQLERHAEQHNQQATQAAIDDLNNIITINEIARKNVMTEREVQEYALIMLKDSGIKAKVIKKYIPVINKLINKYLAAMGFFITFELNEQFQETIRSIHKEQFSYNSFSEGERQKVNLAILFTWRDIAKIRNSMSTNLLVMDETFDSSLDENGVEELVKIMESITGDTNIFVISHKGTMFDKFRSVIEFKKEKNFSKIVKHTDQTT